MSIFRAILWDTVSFSAMTVFENITSLWYLTKALELLFTTDVVHAAEGWQKARVYKIEHECAVRYDRVDSL